MQERAALVTLLLQPSLPLLLRCAINDDNVSVLSAALAALCAFAVPAEDHVVALLPLQKKRMTGEPERRSSNNPPQAAFVWGATASRRVAWAVEGRGSGTASSIVLI